MAVEQLADITKVSRVSERTPTLRTSLPLDLARDLGITDGDSVIWLVVDFKGKKGLFMRKVE